MTARWLDEETAARHLCLRPTAFRARVKGGTLPQPSYHLGPRSPRWDREALDSALAPSATSPNTRQQVNQAVAQILAEGRARRQKATGGRHGQRIPISGARA